MVYDVDGNEIISLYGIDGTTIFTAYDKNGNEIFNPQPVTIKVMDYNVGQWYDGSHTRVPAAQDVDYYALQNGMIQAINPDILCLEEYLTQFGETGRSALTMLQQYFPYIHEENAANSLNTGAGRCICSKYPISDYQTHQYVQTGAPRYYDSCTITVNDMPITVVVTHLNYDAQNPSARTAQLNELIAYLQTQARFIACGDYNTLDCKSTSGADYIAMIQQMLNAGFNCANCSDFGFLETYSDQPVGPYTGCLDNIVTSANIQILSAYVDTTKLSDGLNEKTDHMPLVATLQIGGTT